MNPISLPYNKLSLQHKTKKNPTTFLPQDYVVVHILQTQLRETARNYSVPNI